MGGMGQPGKAQTTLLTPVDVVKADWLSKGNRNPEIFNPKPPKPKPVEHAKDLPEYIVDPGTKTTYLKGKFLGKGGFARAYELTDLTTGQVYAGKIISKSTLVKPHQKEKIYREIELHRQLQHDHVVRFHRFFKDEHNVYIILENCSRKSLDHVMKNRKFLTEPEVRYFMLQLAEGVKYIHSCGIIHRDLKLGNMFLSESMEVKIGDFGLATNLKKSASLEKSGKNNVCGTPNYISPEVLTCQGYCFGSDVWAMGCIMYAMLVGQPPFESATLNETYYRIAMNKYSIPSSISEPARRLVARMLQLKPLDRPSLDEILDHDFFTSGHLPITLPASCCFAVPKFTLNVIHKRSQSEQNVDKLARNIIDLQLSPRTDAQKVLTKSDDSSPKKNCLPLNIRKKITNALCPDKIVKKPKEPGVSAAMYSMVQNALDSIPEDCDTNPPALPHNLSPFVTKWIDYSNKYGFGYQLSDRSIGVFFNDSTRMSLSSNAMQLEYQDSNGKVSTYGYSSIPSSLTEPLTLLEFFSKYMDENLTEGGENLKVCQAEELVRKKIPYMKRWLRSSDCIIMQLNSGTLQINFFEDHTKIVISGDGTVMYIDEERKPATYSLAAIGKQGCQPCIRSCLQYAASVLQDFAQLEGDSS